jgi:hypothetical protein
VWEGKNATSRTFRLAAEIRNLLRVLPDPAAAIRCAIVGRVCHDSIDIQIAEGDMVATRFTSRGTHRGVFMGVEPTNKELSWTGITIDRISEGRIVESWANWDMLGMMQQLGVVAEPGPEDVEPSH